MRSWPVAVSLVVLVVVGAWWGTGSLASGSEPGSPADPVVSRSYVDQLARFRVVTVPAGSQLHAAVDGMEIIVRAGRALAVASPAGGLVNVTAGRDMAGGEQITANHMLIVPRADGRGIQAVTDTIVMVRGPHAIRN